MSKEDIKLLTKLVPSFKMPKIKVMDSFAPIKLGEGVYSGVNFTIAKLAQHDSIHSVYNEWVNGRGGLPSLKSVLEHYPNFFHGQESSSWKRAISERKLLCSAIESRGVEAMETAFAAQGSSRWEGLLRSLRTVRKQAAEASAEAAEATEAAETAEALEATVATQAAEA